MKVQIEWNFPNLSDRLRRNLHQVYLGLAAAMQENRAQLFYSEGRHNGRRGWAPLKFRDGMILQKRGTLRKSIAPSNSKGTPGPNGIVRFQNDRIQIGTNLFYARMMNNGTTKLPGGVLKPVRAQALKIPVPKGKIKGADKGYIFRKSVKIPARPFDDWNSQDQEEMTDTLSNLIARVLNGTS